MLVNPQNIIEIKENQIHGLNENFNMQSLVIYIPFLKRHQNINMLLASLCWFEGEIIVLVSNDDDRAKIDISNNNQIKFINCSNCDIITEIRNLKTFKSAKYYHNYDINSWDLPAKRNFALIHSIQHGFKKILLIDDDIEGISKNIIIKGISSLESNDVSGCLVKYFPDTSVIGHIEQKYGEPYYPFLSGNFLFIKSDNIKSYFPLIYNEDWLFMIPYILKKKIPAIDLIYQKEYNPYEDISRIKFQEFGEVIAEGLFELIYRQKYDDRYKERFWNEYLAYRKSYVTELLDISEKPYIPFIKESLDLNGKIKPNQCINFIHDFEQDILTFKKIVEYET